MPLVEIWQHDFLNNLEEREAFIDPVWRECTQLKGEFLFEIFAAFCPQIVMLWLERFGRLKWRATGFGASVSFFLHLVVVRESGPPIFSLFRLGRSSKLACRLCNR